MGNCCDGDKKRQPKSSFLEDIGVKSSLQMPRQNQKHPLRKQPSGNDSSSAVPSIAEPAIKITTSAGAIEETNGKQETEEGNRQLGKRHLSGISIDSRSSCSSSGSNGLRRKNLTISDFIIDRPLGRGAFGQVYLVTKKDTDRKYAMKTIKKVDMVKLQLIEATILEKTILLRSFHPFVVSLKYSIQTDKKVYLIMEYVQGGEIFTLLKHLGSFQENVAKFIIAEIILGIQYLHETLKIIYRDLKPENILLTKNGHVKISDFGLSKEYSNKDDKAYTFAGTPEYMSPEVVLNKGHNKNVDLWGIGIFLYELVAGYPPFQDKKRNIEKIQKQIIMNRPVYPETFSANLKDLIKSLLQSDPSQRLGADSMDDLKSHSFFHDVEWEELLKLSIESPLKKYTDQEKPLKAIRPRPIQETPMSLNIQLPQIKNLTYNNEDALQAQPREDEIQQENFDVESPKNNKIQ